MRVRSERFNEKDYKINISSMLGRKIDGILMSHIRKDEYMTMSMNGEPSRVADANWDNLIEACRKKGGEYSLALLCVRDKGRKVREAAEKEIDKALKWLEAEWWDLSRDDVRRVIAFAMEENEDLAGILKAGLERMELGLEGREAPGVRKKRI